MLVHILSVAVSLSILGSLGGVIVASSFLLLGDTIRVRLVPWLISYAVGTLVGVALLALVPEALAQLPPRPAMLTLAAGILAFFLLEKAVLWRHCHDDEACSVHSTAASLVIVGDAFHTFVDGAVIAAAVLTSIPRRLTTRWPWPRTRYPRKSATSPSCCAQGIREGAPSPSTSCRVREGSWAPPRWCSRHARFLKGCRMCSRSPPEIFFTSQWPT